MSEQPDVTDDRPYTLEIRTTHFEPLHDAMRELLQASIWANIALEHASPSAIQFVQDAKTCAIKAERCLAVALRELGKER